MTPTQTHPYFVDRARQALAAQGVDCEEAVATVAAWAESHRVAERRTEERPTASIHGCYVDDAGTIHAEATHYRGGATTPGGTYVSAALTEAGEAGGSRLASMARGDIRRAAGRPVIYVRYWDVA